MRDIVPASDGGVSYWRLSALSCIVPRICEVGSLADVAGTTPDEPAVDSTAGGDAHFSCDASSGVSLL